MYQSIAIVKFSRFVLFSNIILGYIGEKNKKYAIYGFRIKLTLYLVHKHKLRDRAL
jgi:hypothetical protein